MTRNEIHEAYLNFFAEKHGHLCLLSVLFIPNYDEVS